MRLVRGELEVHVLGTTDLGLVLDEELAAAPAGAAAEWLAAHVADAKSLLELVDRRAGTLQRVANAAVRYQRGFVLGGPAAHRPLSRSALARALGLHPSTVSRAVQGAVVALPPDGRVRPLADFFGGAVAARETLAALLAESDPPRTDAEAAARLAAAGHTVARRTVAKYRHELATHRT